MYIVGSIVTLLQAVRPEVPIREAGPKHADRLWHPQLAYSMGNRDPFLRIKSKVRFPAGATDFSFLQILQTDCGFHRSSYSMENKFLSGGQTDRGVKSATLLRLTPELYLCSLCLHRTYRVKFNFLFYILLTVHLD
jgi:hypothetical protein